MKKKTKNKSFPKVLLQPFYIKDLRKDPAFNILHDDTKEISKKISEIISLKNQQESEELKKRFIILFKYADINPDHQDSWKKMSYWLAKNYIPGFRVQKQPRKKTKWNHILLVRLWCEVFIINDKHDKGAMHACVILSKKAPWNSLLEKSLSGDKKPAYLYKQYQKAKNNSTIRKLKEVFASDLRKGAETIQDIYSR